MKLRFSAGVCYLRFIKNLTLQKIRVYISKEEQPLADEFMKIYEPYVYQGTRESNLSDSKKLKRHTVQCRFCKRGRDEVTFKENTHLISRLIGNNGFYSIDECDNCNKLFNPLETDLAASFGAERTFDHFLPDRKAPGFESGNGKLGIKKLSNDNIILHTKSETSEDIKVDYVAGTADISMTTQPYCPESAFRALLKIALAILPYPDVPNYDDAFKFLLNPANYPQLDKSKSVAVTESTLALGRPFGQIFKKKAGVHLPHFSEHVFCLYTGHFMFQLSIPCHVSSHLSNNFKFIPAPYIQLNTANVNDNIIIRRSVQYLGSTERIKRDISLHMQFPTDNLVSIDLGKDFLKSIIK